MGKIIDKRFHELAPRFQREPGFTQSLTVKYALQSTSWENGIMREVERRDLGVRSRCDLHPASLRIPITRARCCCPRAHLLRERQIFSLPMIPMAPLTFCFPPICWLLRTARFRLGKCTLIRLHHIKESSLAASPEFITLNGRVSLS